VAVRYWDSVCGALHPRVYRVDESDVATPILPCLG
jgi:hypothetical protein